MNTLITIHDATIFSDLIRTDLVGLPFTLDVVYQTTQLVFDELEVNEQKKFETYFDSGKLTLNGLSTQGFISVLEKLSSSRIFCMQDLSAIQLAQESQSMLLTHINLVRVEATERGLPTYTILWVLEELFKNGQISGKYAHDCLLKFISINRKIADSECYSRLKEWS